MNFLIDLHEFTSFIRHGLMISSLLLIAACAPPPPISIPTLAALPTVTPTPPPTVTASFTPSITPTSTPSFTPTLTSTPTATATATASPTATPVYNLFGARLGNLPDSGITAAFASDFERHVYTFDGHAGEVVTIRAMALDPAVNPSLLLLDPAGTPTAADDNAGAFFDLGARDAILAAVTLPRDGEYAVQVLSGGESGAYRLTLERNAPQVVITPLPPTATPTPSLTPSGTVTRATPAPTLTAAPTETPFQARVNILAVDHLYAADQTIDLPFYGRAGWTVEVRAEGETGVDPIAALIAPDGTVIAENDDSGGTNTASLEAPLDHDGTHLVRVRVYGAGGRVRITVIARAVG